jgi:uncharacterized protein YjcR
MSKTPLTRAELAAAYNVTPRTIHSWLRKIGVTARYGRLPIQDCEALFEKFGMPSGIWEDKNDALQDRKKR